MPRHLSTFTVDSSDGDHLYYFAPADRAPGPYLKQVHVNAIVDIAADGTLGGVELIDDMPPPPKVAEPVGAPKWQAIHSENDTPAERLAYDLAVELEQADLDRNDLVTVNRAKLLAIAERVLARIGEPSTPTHRHKKRGTDYRFIGVGRFQSEHWRDPSRPDGTVYGERADMREVAIYRDVNDGSFGVRPIEEFNDGRFEVLSVGDVAHG